MVETALAMPRPIAELKRYSSTVVVAIRTGGAREAASRWMTARLVDG
jgi:hypothetical protein